MITVILKPNLQHFFASGTMFSVDGDYVVAKLPNEASMIYFPVACVKEISFGTDDYKKTNAVAFCLKRRSSERKRKPSGGRHFDMSEPPLPPKWIAS